jgi:hypothetical protein
VTAILQGNSGDCHKLRREHQNLFIFLDKLDAPPRVLNPRGAPEKRNMRNGVTLASTGRLVILSGPSCVGKSPLHRALARFHPELSDRLHKLVLINSRAPRPGEFDGKDYHFRTRSQIESLKISRDCMRSFT